MFLRVLLASQRPWFCGTRSRHRSVVEFLEIGQKSDLSKKRGDTVTVHDETPETATVFQADLQELVLV